MLFYYLRSTTTIPEMLAITARAISTQGDEKKIPMEEVIKFLTASLEDGEGSTKTTNGVAETA